MTVTVSPVFLFNVELAKMESGLLLDAITDQQVADWEAEWMPELFKALQRLKRAGVERRHWPQSRHWDWRRKTEAVQGMLDHAGFSIVCGGVTQGMMRVDTTKKRCRIGVQKNNNLVYVEYLENAPWNRKELLFDPPRYRGVGSLLVRAAIDLSKELGFKGRTGLHSLPQSNSFYANTCGMTDLGVDPDPEYDPMRYFELTPEQAEAYIEKGNAR
jgi:hypothetical protein